MQPRADSPARRTLPAQWVHRTARRTWYGPLRDEKSTFAPGGTLPRVRRSLEVLRVLMWCDFRARYRAQALGVVWSLLNPLVMMGILSLVFTQVFHTDIPHFPIFLLIGLVVWQWLTSSVAAGTQAFVGNADLVKRTVFAREALPVAAVLSYGINFLIEAAIVVAFAFLFPAAFRLSPALLLVPVFLGLLMVLLIGVTLATSVLNVVYRDVAYIVNTGLALLYWLTPVMYSTEKIPLPYRAVLQWNPAGAIISALRHAVMEGRAPGLDAWATMVAPTAIIFLLGWWIFRRHERAALDHV